MQSLSGQRSQVTSGFLSLLAVRFRAGDVSTLMPILITTNPMSCRAERDIFLQRAKQDSSLRSE